MYLFFLICYTKVVNQLFRIKIMATKEQQIEKYIIQLKKTKTPLNKELLDQIVKMLGPANYKLDAMFVATSDKKELDTVYKNFIVKKLKSESEEKSRKIMAAMIEKITDAGIRKKYRAVLYYMLAKKMGLK